MRNQLIGQGFEAGDDIGEFSGDGTLALLALLAVLLGKVFEAFVDVAIGGLHGGAVTSGLAGEGGG